MANFSKIWPAGLTNGVDTIDETELEDLDTDHTKTINATDGSTHAPSAAIVIGGAGIDPHLAAAAWPKFSDGGNIRTLNRVLFATPCTKLQGVGGQLVASGIVQGLGNGFAFSRLLDNIPHGATVTSIKLRVTVKNTHATLPTTYPSMTVQRIDHATGGLTTYLKSTDGVAGVNEFFVGAPVANVAAYNALGNVEQTYTPDQNNVIDRTAYSYVVSVLDESGGGAITGNLFVSFKVTYTITQLEVL